MKPNRKPDRHLAIALLLTGALLGACTTAVRGADDSTAEMAFTVIPAAGAANAIRSEVNVQSLAGIKSGEIRIPLVLWDPSGSVGSPLPPGEAMTFQLNGHVWEVPFEDLNLAIHSGPEVGAENLQWISVPIPSVAMLQEGTNEIVISNNNPNSALGDATFAVGMADDGGYMVDVNLRHGGIVVFNDAGEVEITVPGYGTYVFGPDGTPADPYEMPPDEILQILAELGEEIGAIPETGGTPTGGLTAPTLDFNIPIILETGERSPDGI